jgi:hypothetical protein
LKDTNAKEAGAIGVLLYNNVDGDVAGGFGDPGDYVPITTITQAEGLALLERVNANETIIANIQTLVLLTKT